MLWVYDDHGFILIHGRWFKREWKKPQCDHCSTRLLFASKYWAFRRGVWITWTLDSGSWIFRHWIVLPGFFITMHPWQGWNWSVIDNQLVPPTILLLVVRGQSWYWGRTSQCKIAPVKKLCVPSSWGLAWVSVARHSMFICHLEICEA
jgi:hypothetical protein